jgi:hypothetical protein
MLLRNSDPIRIVSARREASGARVTSFIRSAFVQLALEKDAAATVSLSHLNNKSPSSNIILSQIFYFHLSNTMSPSLLTGPRW